MLMLLVAPFAPFGLIADPDQPYFFDTSAPRADAIDRRRPTCPRRRVDQLLDNNHFLRPGELQLYLTVGILNDHAVTLRRFIQFKYECGFCPPLPYSPSLAWTRVFLSQHNDSPSSLFPVHCPPRIVRIRSDKDMSDLPATRQVNGTSRIWTQAEDEALKRAMAAQTLAGKRVFWSDVATKTDIGKTNKQCMRRWCVKMSKCHYLPVPTY